jgi:hypothetical protein
LIESNKRMPRFKIILKASGYYKTVMDAETEDDAVDAAICNAYGEGGWEVIDCEEIPKIEQKAQSKEWRLRDARDHILGGASGSFDSGHREGARNGAKGK